VLNYSHCKMLSSIYCLPQASKEPHRRNRTYHKARQLARVTPKRLGQHTSPPQQHGSQDQSQARALLAALPLQRAHGERAEASIAGLLGYVKDKHDRPDAGSDVGGIQDTGLSKHTDGHASHVMCLRCVADVVRFALQAW